MSNQTPPPMTWPAALHEAATAQQIGLPAFTLFGMGSLRSASTAQGRFLTVKRRFVSAEQAKIDGVEWTLWQEQGETQVPVAAFREALEPTAENVRVVLALVRGWLVAGWTPDEARAAVAQHPRARALRLPASVDAG